MKGNWQRWALVLGAGVTVWIGARYLFPVLLPFFLGGVLALAAEPGVNLAVRRFHLPRGAAVGISVSLTLLIAVGAVSLLGAVLVKELGNLTRAVPAVAQGMGQGLTVLEDWLVGLADQAPEQVRTVMTRAVLETFDDGNALIKQLSQRVPGAVAAFVSWLSSGALTVATGVIAGFLISARLPRLKKRLWELIPQVWREKGRVLLFRLKETFGKWLLAQCKLLGLTFTVVCVCFLLMGVPYALLWAAVTAFVDAMPVLGTAVVLLPWAAVSFLQGNTAQGIGMVATFAAAWLARSILEPRIVGKTLGIDPLISLGAFYVGFRLWGIGGMIVAPIAAALLYSLRPLPPKT